jgi:hypothetical protein
MRAAAAATKEAWDKAQIEANAVFETLRNGAAGITRRLKDEFGLDSSSAPSDG